MASTARLCAAALLLSKAVCVDPPAPPTTYVPTADLYAFAAALAASSPDVVKPAQEIGRTVESRALQAFCVGACGDPSTPALLLTAMHHGREPVGALASLHFVRDMVAAWEGGSSSATALLRSRRMIVIPSVNPDAYDLNVDRLSRGASQAMARKNRRPGCASADKRSWSYADVGVDLNRNYDFAWDVDNEGSNPFRCAEDYRGTAPFSEPETAAIRDFLSPAPGAGVGSNRQNVTVAVNWHSYARFINLPYAVQARPQPPDAVYASLVSLAEGLSQASGYGFGHPWTGGLYTCNGEASDWMVANAGVLAFSPEVGPQIEFEPFSQGMWPSGAMLPGILSEAQVLATHALHATGSFVRAHATGAVVKGTFATCAESAQGLPSSRTPCYSYTVSVDVVNKGAMESRGPVVVSAIAADMLTVPREYLGKGGERVPVASLAEAIVVASSASTACRADVFPVAARATSSSSSGAAAAAGGRVLRAPSEARKDAAQEPLVSAETLDLLREELARVVPAERTRKLDFRDVFARRDGQEEEEKKAEAEAEASAGEGEGAKRPRSERKLALQPAETSFASTIIPEWEGSLSVSRSTLAPFHRWPASSVAARFQLPVPPPSLPSYPPDSFGHIAYVAIGDETACMVYGVVPPASAPTDTSPAAVELRELYFGAAGCMPCAAFRLGPITEAPSPSPSPSPATSTAASASGSPQPAAASPSGAPASPAAPSPSSPAQKSSPGPPQPWQDVRFPVGDASTDAASYDLWPWSSGSLTGSAQVALLLAGLVAGVAFTVFVGRRVGLLPTPARRVVLVEVPDSPTGAGATAAAQAAFTRPAAPARSQRAVVIVRPPTRVGSTSPPSPRPSAPLPRGGARPGADGGIPTARAGGGAGVGV
jgi:hypothetical protein